MSRLNSYPLLDVQGRKLKLVNGEAHYFNIFLCDMLDNCAMRNPKFALHVDKTPPEIPMRMISDRNRKSSFDGISQFFVSETRIDPAWIFDSDYDLATRTVTEPKNIPVGKKLEDSESGALYAHTDLYKLRPGDERGREYAGRFVLHKGTAFVDLESPPYLHASSQAHGLNLELGAKYMMELVQTNLAGGVTVYKSEPVRNFDR